MLKSSDLSQLWWHRPQISAFQEAKARDLEIQGLSGSRTKLKAIFNKVVRFYIKHKVKRA